MRRSLLVSLALCLAFAGAAFAQSFSSLEERMTEAEFKAAGLDKLSPEELAALNAFIAGETAKVASSLPAATPRVEDRRGFNERTGPDGAIFSSISGEFRGWTGAGTRIRLDNGQVWEVTDSTSRLRIQVTDPKVTVEPGMLGSWYLKVEGYNTRARVKRIK